MKCDENGSLLLSKEDVEKVTKIEQSERGVTGVIYFMDPSGEGFVVKEHTNNLRAEFASRVLKHFGFHVPASRLVDKGSVEGMAIIDKFNKLPKTAIRKDVQLGSRQTTQFFLVMSRIAGTDFYNVQTVKNLKSENKKELGRLYIYDLLLGNLDRIQDIMNTLSINPGNVIVEAESKQLFAVDNDTLTPVSRNIQKLKNLRKLAQEETKGAFMQKAKLWQKPFLEK